MKRPFSRRKKSPEPVKKSEMADYRKSLKGLEVDFLDTVLLSRRNAWRLTVAFGAAVVVSWGLTTFVIYRYSQPVPAQMLLYNQTTGNVQFGQKITGDVTRKLGTDRYWAKRFVEYYEGYNFYTAQTAYDTVRITADPQVAAPFLNLYERKNPIQDVVGDKYQIVVDVNSVILDPEHGQATVRFTKQKIYRDSRVPEPRQFWIATFSYEYVDMTLPGDLRDLNPWGFLVHGYQSQQETIGVGG